MAYSDATLKVAVDAVAALGNWIGFHTDDPGKTGANEISGGSYARRQTTWQTDNTAGSKGGTLVTSPLPGGLTVTHWSVWSAANGTFICGFALDSPEAISASGGTLRHTPTLFAQTAA